MQILRIGDGTVDVRLSAVECGLLSETAEVLAGSIANQGRSGDCSQLAILGDALGDAERVIYLLARLPWLGEIQLTENGPAAAELYARLTGQILSTEQVQTLDGLGGAP